MAYRSSKISSNRYSDRCRDAIAVIGMSGRFPNSAHDLRSFWNLLSNSEGTVSRIPESRFRVEDYYDENPDAIGKMYVKSGSFLDRLSEFDSEFFDISPREATAMDPQQRLLLEETWAALEDAGEMPSSLVGSETGVFVGLIYTEYKDLLQRSDSQNGLEIYIPTGSFLSAAAGRISYTFGFEGPSMSVDTSCSSSLVALHLACQSLRNRECSRALAAGVHLIVSPQGYLLFCRNRTLSPDGLSRSFDESANGFGRGEGCGVLLLKRLDDALENGDRIHALIRGSAINQDGRSESMSAPNARAQAAVIKKALKSAQVLPEEIGYLEAHGSGTPLGDLTEMRGLESVFSNSRRAGQPLWVGSVKTNIGHAEGAAGIAGVIKTILSLKNKIIPAHLHLKEVNSKISLDKMKFRIPTKKILWSPVLERRIAGVSSFGITGTNAHVILEEAPCGLSFKQGRFKIPGARSLAKKKPKPRTVQILSLSTKSEKAMVELIARYRQEVLSSKDLPGKTTTSLADICYSAALGRDSLSYRLAVVGRTKKEISEKLETWKHSASRPTRLTQGPSKGIVFLFTGGGSQYLGMGKKLYDSEPVFRNAMNRCSKELSKYWKKPLKEVLWGRTAVSLHQMRYLQPALFALEFALSELWASWGIKPDCVMGHSLGEYVAAVVGGIWSLEDGLKLIVRRAQLMFELSGDGAMGSVALDAESVREVLETESFRNLEIDIGAINGPYSTVVSGHRDAVNKVLDEFAVRGVKTKLLPIECASHSSCMDPVLDKFEKFARQAKYSSPRIPIISNVTGNLASKGEISNPQYWRNHLRAPVLFAKGIKTLSNLGFKNFIEMGPQPILLSLGQESLPSDESVAWYPSLEKGREDLEVILESVAGLHTQGINVDWKGFYKDQNLRKVDLPLYPFQGEKYWLNKEESADPGIKMSSQADLVETVLAASSGEKLSDLSQFIEVQIRAILGISKAIRLDHKASLVSLGMNSLMAIPFKNKVEKALGTALLRPLPASIIYNYPTIEKLSHFLLESIKTPKTSAIPNAKEVTQTPLVQEPIAIVGMSCRFPGMANTLDMYWKVLSEGIDTHGKIPKDRFDVGQYYDPNPDAVGKMYPLGGAFIHEIDKFDAEFFSISPNEAAAMDPQQRLLLETSWEAFEAASIPADKLNGSKTGVFVGIMNQDYLPALKNSSSQEVLEAYTFTGNAFSTASGRISHFFGFHGPSLSIDTACSSSLVAVHLACGSLRDRSSDTALAAGVNLILTEEGYVLLSRTRALSPDSRCKTFDAAANGYARGEGCGVLVMRRLSDAIANGDPVLAIIRGSAVNHDGRSSSLTAPNGRAQEALVEAALSVSGIEPGKVSYVEAHGTGTPLGDPIEIESLGRIYSRGRKIDQPLSLGSVKTNIGHTEAAAGIAGVIKIVLALQYKKLPPNLHLKELNPEIKLDGIPARIITTLTDWTPIEGRRIAGVSSFGISGTNAHLILEEYSSSRSVLEIEQLPLKSRTPQILWLSAKTEAALMTLCNEYSERVLQDSPYSLEDICFTANTGRVHFQHRVSVVGTSKEEMRSKIQAWLTGTKLSSDIYSTRSRKLVFLFTGQGSQYSGMGKELYCVEQRFKKIIDLCSEILQEELSISLPSLLWGEHQALLDETEYAQPALFSLEYALCKFWIEVGIRPDILIGHSLGEYVAACIAGVFSLESGLVLIAKRAKLMQSLPEVGSMATLFTSLARVVEVLQVSGKEIEIAAINEENSIVISGGKESVSRVLNICSERSISTRVLNTTFAFHSSLIDPVLEPLKNLISQMHLSEPRLPIISNLSGKLIKAGEMTNPQYWADHTRSTVQFCDGVRTLLDLGYTDFLEIGPRPVLTAMVEEIGQLANRTNSPFCYGTLENGKSDLEKILEMMGTFYVRGIEVCWRNWSGDSSGKKINLPSYPFQRRRFWFDSKNSDPETSVSQDSLSNRLDFICDGSEDGVGHHCIYGVPIVAGTYYLSHLLLMIQKQIKPEVSLVDSIEFETPIALNKGQRKVIRLQLEALAGKKDKYRIEILSKDLVAKTEETLGEKDQENETWVRNAFGELSAIGISSNMDIRPTSLPQTVNQLLERCQQEIPVHHLQDYLHGKGITYGPAYQWAERIFCNQSESISLIRDRTANEREEGGVFHPGQLNCIAQSNIHFKLPHLRESVSHEAEILLEINGFQLFQNPQGKLWCHCVDLDRGDLSAKRISRSRVMLYSESGTLVAKFNEIVTAQATRVQIDRSRGILAQSYELKWVERSLEKNIGTANPHTTWVVVGETGRVKNDSSQRLSRALEAQGCRSFHVDPVAGDFARDGKNYACDFARKSEIQRFLDSIVKEVSPKNLHFIYWPKESVGTFSLDCLKEQCASYLRLLNLIQQLGEGELFIECSFTLVTRGARSVDGDSVELYSAPLLGLWRTMSLELRNCSFSTVDLEANRGTWSSIGEIQGSELEFLVSELLQKTKEQDIAWRQSKRFVSRLVQIEKPNYLPSAETKSIHGNSSYVITGGFGALGLLFADYLAKQGARYLVLIGRNLPNQEAQEKITNLSKQGVKVQCSVIDVSDDLAVRALFSELNETLPEIRGILHAAGTLSDAVLESQSLERYLEAMAPKVAGSWNLHSCTKNLKLDFFVLFSSAASLLGSLGQSNYSAANQFMDSLAVFRRAQGLPAISINWGPWLERGMAVRAGSLKTDSFLKPIFDKEGTLSFEQLLNLNVAQVGVLKWDWSKYVSSEYPISYRNYLEKLVPASERPIALPSKAEGGNVFLNGLRGLSDAEIEDRFTDLLRVQIAKMLGYQSASEIEKDRPLFDHGLDSLMVVRLRNTLQELLSNQIKLKSTLAFDYPNVRSIAGFLTLESKRLLGRSVETGLASIIETPKSNGNQQELIAVIGMSCRFPGGANSLEEFWSFLESGGDAIAEVPKERWDLDRYYSPDPNSLGKMYSRWGGFLNTEIEQFDADFFKIGPLEAETMDPQQRLALEVTWEAIEKSHLDPQSLKYSQTGVFFGVATSDYKDILKESAEINAFTNAGTMHSVIAGRISYLLGLEGPSLSIDTACSSSLVAVHQACRSLKQGESNLAIAGGVNLMLSPDTTIGFCKGRYLASDGRCKTFDESANGYVRGEGAGVLILKRYSDAVKDQNEILALIRGSAVNQDGASGGLTVPSGSAQERVVRKALQDGEVRPTEVDYVEAHGTGTQLGDPIELHALASVLRAGHMREEPLLVGSVKTNIGHLEAAAGVAGIIKVILSMQKQLIPRHLHFRTLNPKIELDSGVHLVIPTENKPWLRAARRRIAGVSGFAFQGTNAHVILEEAPSLEPNTSTTVHGSLERPAEILVLSARTQEALESLVDSYLNVTLADSETRLSEICGAACFNRSRFEYRLALVGSSKSEMRVKLQKWRSEGKSDLAYGRASDSRQKIAFKFGGLALSWSDLGRELYALDSNFKEIMDRCSLVLEKAIHKSLFSILWKKENDSDDPKRIQLGHFCLEYALSQYWISLGIQPDAVLGERHGYYAAGCVAGVFSFEDGVQLVTQGKCLKNRFLAPKVPFISSVTGEAIDSNLLQDPLYWQDRDSLEERFLREIDILKEPQYDLVLVMSISVNHTARELLRGSWISILEELAGLYVVGSPIAWKSLNKKRNISLPTYPFQRKRHWPVMKSGLRGSGTKPSFETENRRKLSSLESLWEATDTERFEILSGHLEVEVRRILGLKPDASLDRKKGLMAMGMDSIMAVEFIENISLFLGSNWNELQSELSPAVIFSHPSIDALAGFLMIELGFRKSLNFSLPEEGAGNFENIQSEVKKLRTLDAQELQRAALLALEGVEDESR